MGFLRVRAGVLRHGGTERKGVILCFKGSGFWIGMVICFYGLLVFKIWSVRAEDIKAAINS